MSQTQVSTQTDEHNALAGRNLQVRKAGGPTASAVSPTATVITSSGTINTRSYGVVRVAPAAAVTGMILQTSLTDGQELTVVNESAFLVSFAVSGTSHVADGIAGAIAGLSSVAFVWDAGTSLWYRKHSQPTPVVSASAVVTASSGTIAVTSEISRVAPAAAVTGVIVAAGTTNGQSLTIVNESTGASSVTMAIAGTSNVANGVSTVIAGLTAASFVWDSATSLWYHRV